MYKDMPDTVRSVRTPTIAIPYIRFNIESNCFAPSASTTSIPVAKRSKSILPRIPHHPEVLTVAGIKSYS